MSSATERRLAKLEQTMTSTAEARMGKGHWIIGESKEELDAKAAALRASPEWQDGDRIVMWRIVDPEPRRTA